MTKDEMRALLAEQMAKYRAWSHAQLAGRIEAGGGKSADPEVFEGVAPDATPYQMEFCIFWDDRARGNVRVVGDLWAVPQKPLLGFIPIYRPDVADDFILAPDGRFVGEGEADS